MKNDEKVMKMMKIVKIVKNHQKEGVKNIKKHES